MEVDTSVPADHADSQTETPHLSRLRATRQLEYVHVSWMGDRQTACKEGPAHHDKTPTSLTKRGDHPQEGSMDIGVLCQGVYRRLSAQGGPHKDPVAVLGHDVFGRCGGDVVPRPRSPDRVESVRASLN